MMNRIPTTLLRAVIIFIAIGTPAFLLLEPLVEGKNADATLVDIYFRDPFLAFAYIASVPFFIGLYQLFKLVTSPDRRTLQIIRNCALITIPFIVTGVAWLLQTESDDRPPVLMMGAIATLICIGTAVTANSYRQKLYTA